MPFDTQAKLEILADAAKYDASCASSGAPKRDSRKGGLGSTTGAGICHSYTPDGRCVSLLKILLTNSCIFDCAYCINRRSSNVRRARRRAGGVVFGGVGEDFELGAGVERHGGLLWYQIMFTICSKCLKRSIESFRA